ncbi:MAG: efflux RND transporter periplasmic adaptor subunit [Planctomycetota bacterium]|nr:efflux RND transporter periplasmic adaptor subunit [Planctomycetota bacterium]
MSYRMRPAGAWLGFALVALATELPGQEAEIVEFLAVERTALREEVRLPGRLLPEVSTMVQARVTGVLQEIPVDYGTTVAAGDLLARLHVPELDAAVKQREADLVAATAAVADAEAALTVAISDVASAQSKLVGLVAEVDLARILHQRKVVLEELRGATREEVDEALGRLRVAEARSQAGQAAVAAAQARQSAAEFMVASAEADRLSAVAALEAAMIQTGFAELVSPFAGVVVRRELDPGALVRADQTVICEVQNTDRLRAELHVPERDAIHVKPGTAVEMTFDALPNVVREAAVSRVARSVTAQGVMVVQVDIDNSNGALLPGMFAYTSLVMRQADAWTLPSALLRRDAVGVFVFVAESGVARRRAVVVGYDDGNRVEILEGLTEQDRVVRGSNLADGAKVRAARDARQKR